MTYLDYDRMAAIDARAFRSQAPYPWMNPEGLLTDAGYQRLLTTLPDVSVFERNFGIERAHGQQSHDRFVLEYHEDLPVADAWHAFVAELRGADYYGFLKRMFGRGFLRLRFHWHYTPRGCSVSPHCDNRDKLGSHIFNFNTAADWDPAWGGQTLILDDGGRFDRRSAPGFEEFDSVVAADNLGNRSVLFARRGNSWHGVREIRCPEGAMRKVFIVIVHDWALGLRREVVNRFKGKPATY
jgi:hypothetical protein